MGVIDVKGTPPVLVTMNPNKIELLIAIRKPSRDMKTPTLSSERESAAITAANNILESGVSLNKATPPVRELMRAKMYKDKSDGTLYIYWNVNRKDAVLWDDFRINRHLKVNLIENISTNDDNWLYKCLTYKSIDGVVGNGKERLYEMLDNERVDDIRRTMSYVSGFTNKVEINRVSRVGGGTKSAVVIEDAGAFQILLKLTLLFPAMIRRVNNSINVFEISNPPLLWHIRSWINDYLHTNLDETIMGKWNVIEDNLNRTPCAHQVKALEEMENAHMMGKKGHFLHLTVGSGKTLLVLSYLAYLKSINELPPYIIYTLPSEAIKSIIYEVEAFGFKVNLLIPLKNIDKDLKKTYGDKIKMGCLPEPFTVNLISHDAHLRMCRDDLPTIMPNAIFIIDEVHSALNETQRTSSALQLAELSREFIALTGTPVIDNHTYKLIFWLSKVVSFGVNESNFWVAAAGMISKVVNTGVKIDRDNVLAIMTPDEMTKYQQHVPPGLGGVNTHPKSEDFRIAMDICYDVATREMINITKEILIAERGVFLVARNKQHQSQIKEMVLNIDDITEKDVYLIDKNSSIILNDNTVETGKVYDYKIVITTLRKSSGYTLSRLSALITSVYPSNNAVRTQLEGRINRLDQHSDVIFYRTVHTGILTHILDKHIDAKNLSMILRSIAEEIDHDNINLDMG